jgi:hypothetical protein
MHGFSAVHSGMPMACAHHLGKYYFDRIAQKKKGSCAPFFASKDDFWMSKLQTCPSH